MQVQQQQITPQQSHSQLESQESLVQSQLADETDQVPHSSRKQKIKQVRMLNICPESNGLHLYLLKCNFSINSM